MTAVAAILPNQLIPLDELGRGGLGKLLARLQIHHLVMTLQTARLLEAIGQHRQNPVVVVEPAILRMPGMGLLGRVGSVRSPLETRGTPLALVADRAAEVLHRMRTRIAHEEVEPRMGGIGLRHSPTNLDFQRRAPGGRVEQCGHCHLAGRHPPSRNLFDHVARLQAGNGSCCRRLGILVKRHGSGRQHHSHRGRVGHEGAASGQPESIDRLKSLVLTTAFPGLGDHLPGRIGLGRGEREHDRFGFRIGRLLRQPRLGLVHPAMAGDAAIESRDITEVVVER